MYRLYALLSFVILCNTSLSSMQLARIAKKTPHTRSLHKRAYATQKPNLTSTDSKKEKDPTIISYKGKTYTPASLAQHVVGKAVSKGIDYIDSWKKVDVDCKCMLPYTCITHNMQLCSALANHAESATKLNHAIKYLEKTNSDTTQELKTIKERICPNLYTCFKKIHFQENRATYITAATSSIIIFGFFSSTGGFGNFLGIVLGSAAGITISSIVREKRISDTYLTIPEKAIRRYIYEETQKIERALKKAEPAILGKIEKAEQKYLPLPTNDQK